MKISKIILCGCNGNNGIFLEYDLPPNFTGEVYFNFGQGGSCRAKLTRTDQLVATENGFNEKKYLDILKNSSILGENSF
jgi:hypothetical protein